MCLSQTMKIVQLINQDNFGIFFDKFHSVLLCFQRVKGLYYERLILILSFLFDFQTSKIGLTLSLFLRNAYFQETNTELIGFINLLFDLIIQKKEKISEKLEEWWVKCFFKLLRLMSVTMLFKEAQDLHVKLISLSRHIWERHGKGSLV